MTYYSTYIKKEKKNWNRDHLWIYEHQALPTLPMHSFFAWRLLCHPDSVLGRLYKARYYTNWDFLSTKFGCNPSCVWQNLLEIQPLVKVGARRRVGNGANIHILDDPWLQPPLSHRICSRHPALVNRKVADLMQVDVLAWDSDLVRDLFNSKEASLILRISLSCNRLEDCWF